ncbi:MAG: cytochrome C biogenesis protein [Stenotrophomonas sp.]
MVSTSVFMALAGLLAAVVAGITLLPLLRAGKRGIWATLVTSMVVATLGLYQWQGTPSALQAQSIPMPASLAEGVEQLQEAMRKNPDRIDGWVLLARSQQELGHIADAAASYEHAVQLAPGEPGLLVEAAQARAQADPKLLFDDTGLQWLQQARKLAPDNERATWLIGIVQRQRGQAEDAAHTWETLLPRLQGGAATALREQIDAARADAGLPPSAPVAAAPASTGNTLTVRVTLAPALQARAASGEETLFVIARIPGGPPMPVAVERHPAQAEPLTVTLDDADSPMPTQKLSALQEVEVFARLSSSGSAIRQDGDVESNPVTVKLPTEKPLEIMLGAQ